MAAAAPIILTAPPLFARQFLFDDRFLKWCDGNQVELDITDAKRDLFGTDQIVAVRLGTEPDPDLVSTPVFDVQLVLAAAPTIAARARPTDRSWWLEQTLLSPGVSDIAWPQVWRALEVRAPETTHPLHFSSYAAALEAACAGHGVLLAPLPFSEREFASGRLSRLSNFVCPAASATRSLCGGSLPTLRGAARCDGGLLLRSNRLSAFNALRRGRFAASALRGFGLLVPNLQNAFCDPSLPVDTYDRTSDPSTILKLKVGSARFVKYISPLN